MMIPVETETPGLKVIDPISLQDKPIPDRRWIVQDWIPAHSTTSLYGDGGQGKSLSAMMLMTSIALNKPWFGLTVTPVKCLGIFCEDTADELHRRQADINRAYGCDFSDLENMIWYSGVGENNILMDFEDSNAGKLTQLYELVEQKAFSFGAQFIVIDTAADTFGGNENSRGHVRQFINALTGLAKRIDGAVLLCAHPSVAGLVSGKGDGGNTAWNNSVRSRLYLERPKEDEGQDNTDVRILSRKKSNYARQGEAVTLIWQEGIFIPQGPTGSFGLVDSITKRNREKEADGAFLRALDAFEEQGRNLSASDRSGNYAPKLMLTSSQCHGFTMKDMKGAMNRLFDAKAIRNEMYGRASNPAQKIVRVLPDSGGDA